MLSLVLISFTLFVRLSIAFSPLVCFFCPGAGGSLAIAAATAALASRFASSSDFVGTWIGRGAVKFPESWLVTGTLVALDCKAPMAGGLGLAAGLRIGTAGRIRPLLGAVVAGLAAAGISGAIVGAGGAKASEILGFDSVGGGGPFWAAAAGACVAFVLGNLTVAAGLSTGNSCCGVAFRALFVNGSAGLDGFDLGPCCMGGCPRVPNCRGGG